jgi:FkbM family methyltransferase
MRNGLRIIVDPQDYNARVLFLFGTSDPKVEATTCALLQPDDVFLDVGANYSSIGIAASRIVGHRGQVHLFEPQRGLAERVREAIVAARLSNVWVHPVALLDRDGEMTIRYPAHHSGRATLVDPTDSDWTAETVQVRAVADYLAPLVRQRAFGVKLDVEGAEPLLMPWLLQQPHLRFVVFEANRNQSELWSLIRKSPFALFGIERRLVLTRLRRVDDSTQLMSFHDLVAVRLPRVLRPPYRVDPVRLGRDLRDADCPPTPR